MPLPNPKTTSPGFLRNVNFSALGEGVIEKLFGEVRRPGWMRFTVVFDREVHTRQTVFQLVVDIDPQPAVSLEETDILRVNRLRRRKFNVPFRVPDHVLEELRNELPQMFCSWLRKALLENAHRFYELDPRMGWKSESPGDELPVSELLDPSIPFSRTGEPVVVPASSSSPKTVLNPSCPFCRQEHPAGSSPLWAGANLMWVHEQCWRRS